MKILEYIGLDTSRVKTSYRKITDAIARDDFRAGAKRLGAGQGARLLDISPRQMGYALQKYNIEVKKF